MFVAPGASLPPASPSQAHHPAARSWADRESWFRVNLPETSKTSATTTDQKKSVNISIDVGGKVYIDRREVGLPHLEPELKSLRASYRDLIVHLNADRAVSYGVVAKAMTAVDRAGITKLSVLTVSE